MASPSLDQAWPPEAHWHFYATAQPEERPVCSFLGPCDAGGRVVDQCTDSRVAVALGRFPTLAGTTVTILRTCAGVAFGMGSSSGQKDSPSASICVADRNLSLQAVSPADHPELPVLGEMCFRMKKILSFYPWS